MFKWIEQTHPNEDGVSIANFFMIKQKLFDYDFPPNRFHFQTRWMVQIDHLIGANIINNGIRVNVDEKFNFSKCLLLVLKLYN